jgi:phage-related minor tail protein
MVVAKDGADGKDAKVIPEGRPKSGRFWKPKQKVRSSFQQKNGVLSHLRKTFEEKEALREKKERLLALERAMVEEKKQKKRDERERREERQKRRMANEYKNSVYQVVRPLDKIFRYLRILISYIALLKLDRILSAEAREVKGDEQEAVENGKEDGHE